MGKLSRLARRVRARLRRAQLHRRQSFKHSAFALRNPWRSNPWLRLGVAGVVVVLGVVGLLCTPGGCSPKTVTQSIPLEGRQVRVRILAEQRQVLVKASQAPVYFTTTQSNLRILDLPRGVEVPITLAGDGWRVGNTPLGTGELVLRPVGVGTLMLGGRAYRGQYRFVPMSPGSAEFDVVNDVHIDDYLKSVVSRELFPNWHLEAYKAQAIAARTYALYEKNAYRGTERHFDLYNDVKSQVYGGIAAETPKSRQAVEETAGVVLAYGPAGQERIFKAYFSACCGGVGQSVSDAFGGEAAIPPLEAKNVGSLCATAPRYNWGPVMVSKADLTRRFAGWGHQQGNPIKNIGPVRAVEVDGVNPFNRPVRYRVLDANGMRYLLSGEDLRRAVNFEQKGEVFYSSFVEKVINEPAQVRFVGGHGHGHGVGMCQYCTQARATSGMLHDAIVLAGYPGARLVRAY